MTQSLVFVDSRLSDYQTLIDGVSLTDYEIIVIDGEQDGLAQMTDALASRSGLASIHVLGHGASGQVHLGTTTLTAANLRDYAGSLSGIGQSLNADGDLLLYGCNVAQGDAGQAFIEQMAQFTGADVAGSMDLTGAAALEGDWVLEATSGVVEAPAVVVQDYSQVLDATWSNVITYNGTNYGSQGGSPAPTAVGQFGYTMYAHSLNGTPVDFGTN
jgi:hypothetical protein